MEMSVRQKVKDLLNEKDYDQLIELCRQKRHFWIELRFRLFDMDEKIRWSAIEAVAKFMKYLWETGKNDKVREFMRNLFWSLNDESGGIGWSAPQTIAEMIVQIPELFDPFGSMMIAHTLDEPPLVKGGLWGIGRLGKKIAKPVEFFENLVLEVFKNDDPETIGLAAWALGEVNFRPALPFLKKLLEQKEKTCVYINGDFQEKQLGQWAEEAIDKIESNYA